MADYYTSWSFALEVSQEELEWVKKVFEQLEKMTDTADDGARDVLRDEIETKFGVIVGDVFEDDGHDFIPFDYSWNDTDERSIWFHGDCGGQVGAAEIVRAFLQQWRPTASTNITWAETCSKPRPGDFAGGAIFITATSKTFFHTADWLKQMHEEFERSKNKKRGRKRNEEG